MISNLDQLEKRQLERANLIEVKDNTNSFETILTTSVLVKNDQILAGGVLYSLISHEVIEAWITPKEIVPSAYIPTFLSLRNKPSLMKVIEHFKGKFDLLMIEGAGIQHPRRFGLASEIGVEVNISTIGVTKGILWGEVDWRIEKPFSTPSAFVLPIYDYKEIIANYLIRKGFKKGICVSVGHKITLVTATNIILPLLRYRIPEPLRIVKKELLRLCVYYLAGALLN